MLGRTDEQRALDAAAHDFLSTRWSLDRARAALDGEAWDGNLIGDEFFEMGWTSLLADPEFGGGGADVTTACVLLEQIGRHLAPLSATHALLGCVAVAGLVEESWRKRLLADICEGRDVVVATGADGLTTGKWPVPERGADGSVRVTVSGARASITERTRHVLVPAAADDSRWLVLPVDANGLEIAPLKRLDAQPVSALRGTDLVLPGDHMLTASQDAWNVVDQLGALFTAADLIGVTGAVLERTRDYAKMREQFGRSIGTFQAVSHRLADILVGLEVGRSLVVAAAHAYDAGSHDRQMLTAAAKAWASDTAVASAEAAVQLHGGIGFTWESDVHLFLRRARAQAATRGTARKHRQLLAAGLGAWAGTTQ